MNMESIAWIGAGWLTASLAVSLLLGRMLRYTAAATEETAPKTTVARRKVARYLRRGRVASRQTSAGRQHVAG